jgi:hypothetical protein
MYLFIKWSNWAGESTGDRGTDPIRSHFNNVVIRARGAYIAVGDCSDRLAVPIAVNCGRSLGQNALMNGDGESSEEFPGFSEGESYHFGKYVE